MQSAHVASKTAGKYRNSSSVTLRKSCFGSFGLERTKFGLKWKSQTKFGLAKVNQNWFGSKPKVKSLVLSLHNPPKTTPPVKLKPKMV